MSQRSEHTMGDEEGPGAPPLVPSGTPVVDADGAPVGQAVAAEPGGMLVDQAGTAAGDVSLLHVPEEAVVEAGEGGVRLAVTGEELAAAERARGELVGLLQAARLTPDRVGLLRGLLERMHVPPADDGAW